MVYSYHLCVLYFNSVLLVEGKYIYFFDNLAPKFMEDYFCYHVSDNYVDLSDRYIDLCDYYVDL